MVNRADESSERVQSSVESVFQREAKIIREHMFDAKGRKLGPLRHFIDGFEFEVELILFRQFGILEFNFPIRLKSFENCWISFDFFNFKYFFQEDIEPFPCEHQPLLDQLRKEQAELEMNEGEKSNKLDKDGESTDKGLLFWEKNFYRNKLVLVRPFNIIFLCFYIKF